MSDLHAKLSCAFVQIQSYLSDGENAKAFSLFEKIVRTESTKSKKDIKKLYKTVNEMMLPLGANGIIYAKDDRVAAVMDALHDIDGGVYKEDEKISTLKQENKRLAVFENRYQFLRNADIDAIYKGGIFAGQTPENLVINGQDLDDAIDKALSEYCDCTIKTQHNQ